MRCGFPIRVLIVALAWLSAIAVEAAWQMPVPSGVDPSIAVRQLHSDEAVSLLNGSGRHHSPLATSGYAIAAIVTIGIGLDSLMAHKARFDSERVEVEERQET